MLLYEYLEQTELDDVLFFLMKHHSTISPFEYAKDWEDLKKSKITDSILDSINVDHYYEHGKKIYQVWCMDLISGDWPISFVSYKECLGVRVICEEDISNAEVMSHILFDLTNDRLIRQREEKVVKLDDYDNCENFVVIRRDALQEIIFKSYFRAEITTAAAATLLGIETVKFVEIYEKWVGDNDV